MHNYTTVKDGNGFDVLVKDGKEAFCPYVPPLMRQSAYTGQGEMFRLSCNTGCPHCELRSNEDGSKNLFFISCSGNSQIFKLDDNKEEPQQPKLIQM